MPRSVYTEWWWPPSPTVYRTVPHGYSSFENLILPEMEPPPGSSFLWAHGFKLVGGNSGHVGLQVDRGEKRAVFLIEGGLAGGDAGRNGFSIPFPWSAGREYALRVSTEEEGWWSALVQDQDSGHQFTIGHVQVPATWRRLTSWSVMSSEYLGSPLGSCADIPRTSVFFGPPTANDGRFEPERSHNRLGDGTCSDSYVEAAGHGVRHRMGT